MLVAQPQEIAGVGGDAMQAQLGVIRVEFAQERVDLHRLITPVDVQLVR